MWVLLDGETGDALLYLAKRRKETQAKALRRTLLTAEKHGRAADRGRTRVEALLTSSKK